MWSVLHFKEDNTVEVVPDFWFNYESGKCAWPTHNPSRFIEKSHIPSKKYFKYLKARVFNGCEKINKSLTKQKDLYTKNSNVTLPKEESYGLNSSVLSTDNSPNIHKYSYIQIIINTSTTKETYGPKLFIVSNIGKLSTRQKDSFIKISVSTSPTKETYSPNLSKVSNIESIKLNPQYENCIQEIEDNLKIYLAQAPFRIKRHTRVTPTDS